MNDDVRALDALLTGTGQPGIGALLARRTELLRLEISSSYTDAHGELDRRFDGVRRMLSLVPPLLEIGFAAAFLQSESRDH